MFSLAVFVSKQLVSEPATTTKFEIEKFDGKSNFFFVEDANNGVAREGGHTQGPALC